MKNLKRAGLTMIAVAMLVAGCAPGPVTDTGQEQEQAVPTPTPYGEQLELVDAVASSETAWGAANAIDGILRTRWRPTGSEVEWIYVDLGESHRITRVVIHWYSGFDSGGNMSDNFHATHYQVQVSDDAENWTLVRDMVDADGLVDDITGLDVTGRYVRIDCLEVSRLSGGPDNYDVWDIEVYGEAASG
jgi:hypothetical protein